jgi:hypothetical protein
MEVKSGKEVDYGRREKKGSGDELADTINFFPPSEGFQEPFVIFNFILEKIT